MRRLAALAALLALSACDLLSAGPPIDGGGSLAPTSNGPISNVPPGPIAPGLAYEELTLEVDGAPRAVAKLGARKAGVPVTTFVIGTDKDTWPAGTYGLTLTVNGTTDADFKPSNVRLSIIVGTGQAAPASYFTTEGTTPKLDKASAANGKGTYRFQGELTCSTCIGGPAAPPPAIQVDLTITGLALR